LVEGDSRAGPARTSHFAAVSFQKHPAEPALEHDPGKLDVDRFVDRFVVVG
jgi:hypothetical protein